MRPVHKKRAHRIISSGGLIIGVALLASAIGKSPVEKIGPILFTTNRDDGNLEIYAMDTNGENLRRLTDHPARDTWPRWSPNGKKILFQASREHGTQIYTMNPDGSNITNVSGLATLDNATPDWSPDGKKIVFWSSRDGNDEIYIMNADGSSQARVTNHPARDMWPAWSPDGKKIAFASSDYGFNGINIINKDGTGRVALTNRINTAYLPDREPCWSPNGREILYSSYEDIRFELYLISVDGSNKRRLTYTTPTSGNITPDWSRRAFVLPPKIFH